MKTAGEQEFQGKNALGASPSAVAEGTVTHISPGPRRPHRNVKSALRKRRPVRQQSPHPATSALDPSLYINRELSWLEFNQRVLDEALDLRHPLLERAKFLAIVSSNLDEFFMIRVAGIKEQILADVEEFSPDGQTPLQQLRAIHNRVEVMIRDMSACFWKDLHPKLAAEGIVITRVSDLGSEEYRAAKEQFAREIYPVLTPLAFDPGHPFPYISNLSLNLAVVVSTPEGEVRFARVKIPDVLPRLLQIPNRDPSSRSFKFVWLEDLIADNLGMLFPGLSVKESYAFRLTRNAEMEIQEDEAEDLIRSIEESIRQRRFGSVVRVGVAKTMPAQIKNILIENLEVSTDDVYELTPPLGLGHLMALLRIPRPDLKDPPYHAPSPLPEDESEDIFAAIRRGDILLHHPYDSFSPVVQFIRAAATDPNVLAIKQTLYRIGKESPLIPLFIKAAENGKQVAVLVELKARFDEENNIGWAKQLERAGIHVVYGLVGLKTHAKMALVVRKEAEGLRRYAHLGTGNYNSITARVYTDFGYFTCNEEITDDLSEVFNYLTGYSRRESYRKLAVAPVSLRRELTALIDREIEHARNGRQAGMILKMNALTDVQLIEKLYEASKNGVRIDMIIRGICSLRPGLKGVSETIRVFSVVGRYLEHSRVFYFENGGHSELYLSSADFMSRNLDRRVELMFPVGDPAAVLTIKKEALEAPIKQVARTRILRSDGQYIGFPQEDGEHDSDSQQSIMTLRSLQKPPANIIPKEVPADT